MKAPGCVVCGKESTDMETVTENVHEMVCAGHQRRWSEVPLLSVLSPAQVLAQWRDFVFREKARLEHA